MDSFHSSFPTITFFFISLLLVSTIAKDSVEHLSFSTTISSEEYMHGYKLGKEMETHLHFYFHDTITGSKPTAVRVAQGPNTSTSATGFGLVMIMDDPLTEGPEPSSKLIGRAQGMYSMASQEEVGLLVVMNLAFFEGEFNGSSLSVLGRNTVFSETREMPVLGGTGRFRYARGYAVAKNHDLDLVTGNAIVEYNVHVLHH
ncbi:hypothetical protein J5N97_022303 [Dioscorea zingiberensis]|uniref:Dirigent protein n=1 Tax=Dioscorea zingiberensis TaxID=325984 RepID=A0A9D5C9T2_9LILI|nr:hypothetical protein J5N97_022303 [Dioscorea zingiberensis]